MARRGCTLQSWWLEGRVQTVPDSYGSDLRAVVSVGHLIQISIDTRSISSRTSYELHSTMEMQPQSCSSVFSQPVDPPTQNLASVVTHRAWFPPVEAVTFFLERAQDLKQCIGPAWKCCFICSAVGGPSHLATVVAPLRPVHVSSSLEEILIPRVDKHHSAACFNRMSCGLTIFLGLSTLQAPGDPPCCVVRYLSKSYLQ